LLATEWTTACLTRRSAISSTARNRPPPRAIRATGPILASGTPSIRSPQVKVKVKAGTAGTQRLLGPVREQKFLKKISSYLEHPDAAQRDVLAIVRCPLNIRKLS